MTNYIYPPVDQAPGDVYQRFVTNMQALVPGWQPAKGNLDDFIALAFAAIIAQLGEITSDVATAIYRYFGAFIANLPPVAAAPAQGVVNFTLISPAPSGSSAWTIPANMHLLFTDPNGNTQGFTVTQAVNASPGATAVNGVSVQADFPGVAGNNITGVGQVVTPPLAWVQSVQLQGPTTNGQDAEDDDTYLGRLRQLYTVLTPKPVVANDFSVLARQQSGVGRATTLDGFDPANWTITGNLTSGSETVSNVSNVNAVPVGAPVTGANIPAGTFVTGTVPASNTITLSSPASAPATGESITIGGSLLNGGEVSTFVTDTSGNAMTSTAMAVIQAALAAQRLANFKINVLAPTYTTLNVTATVYAWLGQDALSIQGQVQQAIQNYLAPLNWGQPPTGQATTWINDPVVRYASLEHAILSVPGVHYVAALTINGGTVDVPLLGVVPLPQAGTVTVTVNVG